jgi:hypothetical protein
MEINIMVNFKKVNFVDLECIFSIINKNMRGNSRIISLMVKGFYMILMDLFYQEENLLMENLLMENFINNNSLHLRMLSLRRLMAF